MASITKHGNAWRAQVYKQGQRRSAIWSTKAEAKEWAARTELALDKRKHGGNSSITLEDAIEEYLGDAPDKWESLRLNAFQREVKVERLRDITSRDIAKWRDGRLKKVKATTVAREGNLVRRFFKDAVKEKKWLQESPFEGVTFPSTGGARQQVWRWQQIRRMCRRLGYVTGKKPETKSQEVAYAFLIALRTGMRAGEVLRGELKGNVVVLDKTKTTDKGTIVKVPVTKSAIRLLGRVKFTISSGSLDALFRKTKGQVLIGDLTFHDTRATALTLLSRKVDPLTLARISRHTDLKELLKTYYRETAEEIAARL